MPEVPYTVRVRVGTAAAHHEWNIAKGAAAAYGPLDGLEVFETVTEGDLWPAVPGIAECRFSIVAAEFDDLPHVRLGAVVHVETKFGGVVVSDFKGRVAECSAEPHTLGVVFSLVCLDFKADLREFDVGAVAAPAESHYARMARWVLEAGYAAVPVMPPAARFSFGPVLASLSYDPVIEYTTTAIDGTSPGNALDMLQAMLAEWPMRYVGLGGEDGTFLGYARPALIPQGTADLAEPTTWAVVPVFENPAYAGALMVTLVGGLWSLTPVRPASGRVAYVPASAVDFGARFNEDKAAGITKVTVTNEGGTLTRSTDLGIRPPVRALLENVKSNTGAHLKALADEYCPAEVPSVRWVAEAFTYHAERDLPGRAFVVDVPNSILTRPVALGDVVTVAGIDPDKAPTGREWYTGQLATRKLTLTNKRPVIEFQLRRPDFSDKAAVDAATFLSPFTSSAAAATIATLNPRDTFDDYRLARWRLNA